MTLRFTFLRPSTPDRGSALFVVLLAVSLAAFLLLVGLGPEALPFQPGAPYSDAAISHWPNALFLRHSVLDDHALPLWRPLLMSGQPFAANPLNKVWYPPQWLVLLIPPALHLTILTWLHLVLAGAGAWAWGRATGLHPWPAALAGCGYAFAPRLISSVGAGHLDLVYAAGWVPWLLWAVFRATQSDATRRMWIALGVFAALCFLADVRLSAYAFVTAAAYLAWRGSVSQAALRSTLPRAALAALIAAGLTAVQWVPVLLLRADLSRQTITLHDAAVFGLTPGQWIGLLIGQHGGSWETLIYVGISTLALAIAALLLRPRALWFWGALLLLLALYAMGEHGGLWTLLNRAVPVLRWWRVPPRVWLVAALILPYLAAWGAQLLAENPPDRRAARLGAAGLFSAGSACGLFSAVALSGTLSTQAALGVFALPAVALVMLLALSGRLPARTAAILFTLIVVADVLWIDRTLLEGRGPDQWLEPYRPLAEFLRDDGVTRVYSPSYSLPQQAAAYWNIPQFGGVDPFQMSAYITAAEAATGVQASGYSVTIPAYESRAGDSDSEEDAISTANRDALIRPDLLGQWLVSHVVSAFPLDVEGLVLAAQIDGVYVYRNAYALPVTLDWDGPNRVTVRTSGPVSGPLYAVAAGRWKGESGVSPGLPGPIDDSETQWTYVYSPSEIGWSLLAGAALLVLAGVVWKGAIRD